MWACSYSPLVVVFESVFNTAQEAAEPFVVRNLPLLFVCVGKPSTTAQALSPLRKVDVLPVPEGVTSAKLHKSDVSKVVPIHTAAPVESSTHLYDSSLVMSIHIEPTRYPSALSSPAVGAAVPA